MSLGKKQQANQADFLRAWENIETLVTRSEAESLVEQTVDEVTRIVGDRRSGYGWSGGKDSQALRVVMELAGIEPCVFAMSNLEYPAFLAWVTDNMPFELDVINTGQDLIWLMKNPEMLFPQDATTAAKWFKIIQHKAQKIFYRRHELEIIILGRRRQDGNYTGGQGQNIYTDRYGVTRYSPIVNWTHEQILAVCHYFKKPLPPIYYWPNGFVVGTGSWPARQWTGSIENGWREVYTIDKSIVLEAAAFVPSASTFLEKL